MKIKKLTCPVIALTLLMLIGCSAKEKQIEQRVQRMAEAAELGTVEYTMVQCWRSQNSIPKYSLFEGWRKT